MGALKRIVLVALLVGVLAASQGEAQPVLGGFVTINGTVFCSVDGNIVANATTPTPPFADAQVQVSCGGNVVSSVITDATGTFAIVLNPLQYPPLYLVSSCKVVVATPLVSCNASLPVNGTLQGSLQVSANTAGIVRLVVLVFRFILG